MNFQMFKLDFEKEEEPEIKLPTSIGSSKKQEFQKNICFIDYAKGFDCVDHNKLWKILKKMGKAKKCTNYCTIALISHSTKVILKIFQAKLQQYVNREIPDVHAGSRKGRRSRDQIANICGVIGKAR